MGTGRESVVTLVPEENKESKKFDFLFSSILDGKDDLEKMFQNMEFYRGETDTEYTVEGSCAQQRVWYPVGGNPT